MKDKRTTRQCAWAWLRLAVAVVVGGYGQFMLQNGDLAYGFAAFIGGLSWASMEIALP